MSKSYSESYASAGVDVTAGYRQVELIKPFVKSTNRKGVLGSIGGFGGLFAPDFSGMTEPVLVSGTDGVGTKLKLAFILHKHDTVGIDAVAMCVNDIICSGAEPLFFLDYIACGKNKPEVTSSIVEGVAAGCRESGCALVGGETAEHPGMMPEDEYDLAGFAVGIADKPKILEPKNVQVGDAIIALPSNGLHSNGFSLVRKVFSPDSENLKVYHSELGRTLGEELLTPTSIYVKPVLKLLTILGDNIHGISHITGGGWYENIPRMLPEGTSAAIDPSKITRQPIFDMLAKKGGIPLRDMYNTYNMGAGMFMAVSSTKADEAAALLRSENIGAIIAGEVISGEDGIIIDGIG